MKWNPNKLFYCSVAVILLSITGLKAQVFVNISSETNLPDMTSEVTTFTVDQAACNKLRLAKTQKLNLAVPFLKYTHLDVELYPISLHAPGFIAKERSASGDNSLSYNLGAYYKGKVIGQEDSSVLLSFQDGEISGVIWFQGETFNLGKMKNSTKHILYRTEDTDSDMVLKCATSTDKIRKPAKQVFKKRRTACNTFVDIYFECDYDMYLNLGSSTTTVINYVNTVFAEVNSLYSNESINIQISEIVVWTTNDGYANGTAGLSDFASANNGGFNGDVAHLLTNDSGSHGGIAYVDQLCGNLPFAYSDIVNSSSTFPSYSWDVQVVAHELGHNFGSPHTHDCAWGTNGDQQIDDCGNLALGGGGNCYNANSPIVPSGGGTVMSYCHLNSVGINFNNGFGSEPGDLLRSKHSNCFCDNSSCDQSTVITGTGTYYAKPDKGNGASSNSATHADWYKFIPTTNGSIDFYSCNEGVDTRVLLHTGVCNALVLEATSDDDCTSAGNSNYASELFGISVTAGTTYFIEWDNRWSTAGFNWEFIFNSNGGGTIVNITCPQNYTGLNTCSPSDYNSSLTGVATSNTPGVNISYADQLSSTNCSVAVLRTWTASKIGGNNNTCNQQINLQDTQDPLITNCPSPITVNSNTSCQAVVNWTVPVATDYCSSPTVNSNYNPGATFSLGTTYVNYTFSDQCNNSASCVFGITVLDNCNNGSSVDFDDCDAQHLILNTILVTNSYNAEMTIQASGKVLQNRDPILKAGQDLEFKPGFEIPIGSSLQATIENCNN